ncbi:hypothetical protein [Streptomyces murinus]|uniref:hypothetical protein n=1 Tax=Streptomyces murinus TaxID=33900 RepID=UPI003F47613B
MAKSDSMCAVLLVRTWRRLSRFMYKATAARTQSAPRLPDEPVAQVAIRSKRQLA